MLPLLHAMVAVALHFSALAREIRRGLAIAPCAREPGTCRSLDGRRPRGGSPAVHHAFRNARRGNTLDMPEPLLRVKHLRS